MKINKICLTIMSQLLLLIITSVLTYASSDSCAEDSECPDRISFEGNGFSLHKETYFLPFSFTSRNDQLKEGTFKFQLSFKQQIFHTNAYFGFTQKSFWNAYDNDNSSPFRESNYNPELFYDWTIDEYGKKGFYFGFEHESNGQPAPTSRSWNRIYLSPYFESDKLRVDFKLWYRAKESAKEFAGDQGGDDNPDINEYLGNFELRIRYEFWKKHMISLMGRRNLNHNQGAFEANYTIPTPKENAFFIVHFWSGYGESLIDYNRSLTRFGLGVMYKR